MASICPPLPMKIEVKFETRPDGGLRAYSDQLPMFALSNRNPGVVMGAIEDVLTVMLSETFGVSVMVKPMVDVAEALEHRDPRSPIGTRPVDYVGIPAAA